MSASHASGQVPAGGPQTFGEALGQIERMRSVIDLKDETILELQAALSSVRATLGTLRGERLNAKNPDPKARETREVFLYWKEKLQPRAKALTDERAMKVRARLSDGYTVADIKRAVDGCALSEYHTKTGRYAGRDGNRYVDLGAHICGTEAKLLSHIERADEADQDREHRDLVPAERLVAWQEALDSPVLLQRLHDLRGWTAEVIRQLGLGLDQGRVVFPLRDERNHLVGICRYQPNPDNRSRPKLIAEGERALFPAPETVDANLVWLVEGEPDAVAMRSIGLPAVGVPGVSTWKDGWGARFTKFDRVFICFDCDGPGRRAAHQRLTAFENAGVSSAKIIDLDPDRDDGYDVGDLLVEMGEAAAAHLSGLTVDRSRPGSFSKLPDRSGASPFERFLRALEDHGSLVRRSGPSQAYAQCPAHDDRDPSLSITEADDRRVLLSCKVGCENATICAEIGVEMRELFA